MLHINVRPSRVTDYDLNKPHIRHQLKSQNGHAGHTWIIQAGNVFELGSGRLLGPVGTILRGALDEALKTFGHKLCDMCGRVFPCADGESGLEGHMYYDHREMLIARVGGNEERPMVSEQQILEEAERSAGLVAFKSPEEKEKAEQTDKTGANFKKWDKGTLVAEKP